MLNRNRLRAEIARNGFTQSHVANLLGISLKTMSIKMRDGSFTLPEANKLISLLDISEPSKVFFDHEDTRH